MSRLGCCTVRLTVEIQVDLMAEGATDQDVTRYARRSPDEVRGAVERALQARETEAGWLDDDRSVFLANVASINAAGREVAVVA